MWGVSPFHSTGTSMTDTASVSPGVSRMRSPDVFPSSISDPAPESALTCTFPCLIRYDQILQLRCMVTQLLSVVICLV